MSRSVDQTENLSLLQGGHLPTPEEGPSKDLLQVFPNVCKNRLYIITLDFPEFTSLCPVTHQPDFGRIYVEYIPNDLCVETKSFKLYMFAYRTHHTFMETLTNTILDDLTSVAHPAWCRVQGLFAPRGATRLNVYAEEYGAIDPSRITAVRTLVHNYRIDRKLNMRFESQEIGAQ